MLSDHARVHAHRAGGIDRLGCSYGENKAVGVVTVVVAALGCWSGDNQGYSTLDPSVEENFVVMAWTVAVKDSSC